MRISYDWFIPNLCYTLICWNRNVHIWIHVTRIFKYNQCIDGHSKYNKWHSLLYAFIWLGSEHHHICRSLKLRPIKDRYNAGVGLLSIQWLWFFLSSTWKHNLKLEIRINSILDSGATKQKSEQYQKHHHQLPASMLRLTIDAQETSETESITATLTELGCSLFIPLQPWNLWVV